MVKFDKGLALKNYKSVFNLSTRFTDSKWEAANLEKLRCPYKNVSKYEKLIAETFVPLSRLRIRNYKDLYSLREK